MASGAAQMAGAHATSCLFIGRTGGGWRGWRALVCKTLAKSTEAQALLGGAQCWCAVGAALLTGSWIVWLEAAPLSSLNRNVTGTLLPAASGDFKSISIRW